MTRQIHKRKYYCPKCKVLFKHEDTLLNYIPKRTRICPRCSGEVERYVFKEEYDG